MATSINYFMSVLSDDVKFFDTTYKLYSRQKSHQRKNYPGPLYWMRSLIFLRDSKTFCRTRNRLFPIESFLDETKSIEKLILLCAVSISSYSQCCEIIRKHSATCGFSFFHFFSPFMNVYFCLSKTCMLTYSNYVTNENYYHNKYDKTYKERAGSIILLIFLFHSMFFPSED